MPQTDYPQFFADRVFKNDQAMELTVKSGRSIASGFATSEPTTFYSGLMQFIQAKDITDLNICQALFMAPHPICVGDALNSKGLFDGLLEETSFSLLGRLARKANLITRKIEGLKKLVEHYNELKDRRIRFTSPFIGAATNMVIPKNPMTKMLFADYAGRNTTRMGITDMHSIHFPDALEAIGYDPDNRPRIDAFVCVMTPPDENGELSHGPACGANGEIIEKILNQADVDLLLYINPNYPFTRGYTDAPNTIPIERFKALAQAGRLYVVEDTNKVPALPTQAQKNPSGIEQTIAENVVNHMELHRHFTYDRAIQVGFGGTGVLAIKALKASSWRGRSYTEMLEPYTLDLLDAGKITGSHFIEKDGTRTQLDEKMVCTFTIGEESGDFYSRLHHNPAIVIAPASRVVIPEGFYYGLGINNCLSIDFNGHVNIAGRYKNHHSGIGGGAQIIRGLSRGGIAYLCLKSTHKSPEGMRRTSIVPYLPHGTPVGYIGPDLMGGREGARFFLVTEHGVAQLSGLSQAKFIQSIISVAHPDFRDSLKKSAWELYRVKI